MHLARAVAAELLIGPVRPPSGGPAEAAAGRGNGRRPTPLLDRLLQGRRPRRLLAGPDRAA
jgi:hypothetical protein